MVRFTIYPDLQKDTADYPYAVTEGNAVHMERFHDIKGVFQYITAQGDREALVSVLGSLFRIEFDEITE